MGKELEKIAGIPMDKIQELERVAKEYKLSNLDGDEMIAPALKMAEGMVLLRRLLTEDVMASVNILQGSRLGFRTDKRAGEKYPVETVKDCFIEALMMGLRPIGNEFNIIASNTYATKEGFQRLVKELPGLKNLDLRTKLAAADFKQGTTIDVGFTATWTLDGQADSLDGTIPIRVNQGMGADAVLGKCWRKALARIHQKVTGSDHELPEGDVEDCGLPSLPTPTASESVLTPGHHTTRKKKVDKGEDAETAPKKADRQKVGDKKKDPMLQPKFEMTGVLTYRLEETARGRGWDMDDLGSYVEEQTGGKVKDIPDVETFDEIMEHLQKKVPEGDVK